MGSRLLCLWCGRFTALFSADGMADCDRVECARKRVYESWLERLICETRTTAPADVD